MQAARGFLNSLHFGTRFLIIFMTIFYLLQLALFDDTVNGLLTMYPRRIIENGEVWRLITSMFGHLGIFHLVSNMYSFSFLGMTLETTIGTLSYFYHILVFGILSNLLAVGISYFMYFGGDPMPINTQAMGFSGVLFALIVIDVHLSGGPNRSVLGFFTVPSWLYPWVMLFILSLIIPNVSFMGHLCGILVGYLYKFKLLSWLTPPNSFFGKVERAACRCCTGRLGYVSVDNTHDASDFRPYAFFQHVYRDTPSDETPPQQGFAGAGRTLGDIPPVEAEQEPHPGEIIVNLDEEEERNEA